MLIPLLLAYNFSFFLLKDSLSFYQENLFFYVLKVVFILVQNLVQKQSNF
ncbi:hypothetical protein MPNE_0063 [Mycoplasmoides pneumoniae FH]|uniref:Uncharacterized protein n=1 Tax=Mycoplasmoides pneumoniae (strain ATCC 15531 / DSM 23978 / CIP 103766 / NBRC 14401 / NCTC 10119 / FH) TaxID=722438 RepID=A0A0H3DNA7_MYCPB|nr:hypothetical protein MPNE_0063 [Mycoplasmoides pneumoniae FH]